MMGKLLHSSRIFWSFAVVATAFVLVLSVALGKVVGVHLLEHGIGRVQSAPSLTSPNVPVVFGGQVHAAAALGQSSPIWPQAPHAPAAASVPNPPVSTFKQPAPVPASY
jgi:hypothetical protein